MTSEYNPTNIPVGTLTDKMINDLALHGHLIPENFESRNTKQACYELRASNIYHTPLETNRRYVLQDTGYILVKPKQLVVIITLESIHLPPDILARILTKGKLFSIGLSAVNTYADPGFFGKLGIVFFNSSNNYLKINPKDSIAKIEFSKLASPVVTPYRGQHGYEAEIWPIPVDMIATDEEISKDDRVSSQIDEIVSACGKDFGEIAKRVFRYERIIMLFSTAYFLLTFSVLAYINWSAVDKSKWTELITSIGLGLGTSLLGGIILLYATSIRRKK